MTDVTVTSNWLTQDLRPLKRLNHGDWFLTPKGQLAVYYGPDGTLGRYIIVDSPGVSTNQTMGLSVEVRVVPIVSIGFAMEKDIAQED
jgi:hypothetical protein